MANGPRLSDTHALNIVVSLPHKKTAHFQEAWKHAERPGVNLVWDIPRESHRDEFPPYRRHTEMWMSLQSEILSSPVRGGWVARCDYDTFLDADVLLRRLESHDKNAEKYLGIIGTGREDDRARLDLKPFAMGGGCEIVTESVLEKIDFETCRKQSRRALGPYKIFSGDYHSDAEFGRCMYIHNISAESIRAPYKIQYGVTTHSKQQAGLQLCDLLNLKEGTLIAHPVKDPTHLLLAASRAQGFKRYHDCSCSVSPRQKCLPAKRHCNPSTLAPCTFEPVDYYGVGAIDIIGWNTSRKKDVPECLLRRGGEISVHIPISPQIPNGISTGGEQSLVASMEKVLSAAIERGADPFLVLEDDFMLHRDTCERWKSAQACAGAALQMRGVMLLGHTTWRHDAWPIITSAKTCPEDSPLGTCYEETNNHVCLHGTDATLGTFAVLYSLEAARFLLSWIRTTKGFLPYDHAYKYMMEAGIGVRMAFPPIVIADVSHVSKVNPYPAIKQDVAYRHKHHRWGPRSEYVFSLYGHDE